jgi:F-type H+-transporting ATPase subunit epsilon
MSATLHVELVTPEDVIFSGEAEMVQVPGQEGEFGVLPKHAPLVALMSPGLVKIRGRSHDTRAVFVTGGVAEVNPHGCILLADGFVDMDTLKREDIEKRIADAQAALQVAATEVARAEAQRQLAIGLALKNLRSAH